MSNEYTLLQGYWEPTDSPKEHRQHYLELTVKNSPEIQNGFIVDVFRDGNLYRHQGRRYRYKAKVSPNGMGRMVAL